MHPRSFPIHLPIFQYLTPAGVETLAGWMERGKLAAGEVVLRQGERSDALYILVMGSLRAMLRLPDGSERCVAVLRPGDCAGAAAPYSGQARLTGITAGEDSEVLCLPKAAFDRLATDFPELSSEIGNRLLRLYQRAQIGIIMTGLFGQVSDETLEALQEQATWLRLHSGEVLFRQGDPGDALYAVVQGRLRFSVEEADAARPGGTSARGRTGALGEVGAGEFIGEFAMLAESGTPESLRSATVYATRLTDVVGISRSLFESLTCQYPQAVLNLTRRIIHRERLIDQNMLLGSSALVICVAPASAAIGQRAQSGAFARLLAEAFQPLGCTLLLDPARFDERFGKPGAARTPLDHPNSLMIHAWMDEQECEQQYVIYDTTPDVLDRGRLSAWARRCLGDADLVLLVGEGGVEDGARPGEVERLLAEALHTVGDNRVQVDLALVHPAGTEVPAGTAAWLSAERGGAGPFQAHYHVRDGRAADFRRMARRISGRTVGLALSGGGARGWAHIGAIRALEEAGIEVDWVGGASMGSIIAAVYALGWDVDHLEKLAADFADPKKLLDYTFPYAAITSTRRIAGLLQQVCGTADIEDTWRPFFCVSANLTRGEEQLHRTGKLWKAIRASMAFPAVFAPVLEDGCVLIDGGAANNLPLDHMRELCPNGKVIGVNLVTNSPLSGEYHFEAGLSGWQALFSRFLPFAKRVKAPTLLDIVAGMIYSATQFKLIETQGCADLLINVPVEAYGLLEFEKYAEIVELGYRTTKDQINGFQVP